MFILFPSESEKYTSCSMCNTIGDFEENKLPSRDRSSSLSLPPINIQNTIKNRVAETVYSSTSESIQLPRLADSKSLRNKGIKKMRNYTAMLEQDFLKIPEEFENPQEVLKVALQNIKENQWQSSTPAIINLMQISRFQPELLYPNMPLINRTLCSLIKNIKPQIVRTACQVAMELYKTIQFTQRPECDELAAILLLKSTHINKGIRYDAQRALGTMVTFLPLSTCIRILSSEHGAGHRNPRIRMTTSHLVYDIVNKIGVNYLLSNSNLIDARRRILRMCTKFLVDGNHETRNNAKKTLKPMTAHCDFDTFLYQDVDSTIIKTIDKDLIVLRYD